MTPTLIMAALTAGIAGYAIAQTPQAPQTAPASGPAATVSGAPDGGIADAMQPRFRTFAVERKHPDFVWTDGRVAVGTVLPAAGVIYHDIPAEYGVAPEYRYTRVNGQYVLVDPQTRRIMQIIR